MAAVRPSVAPYLILAAGLALAPGCKADKGAAGDETAEDDGGAKRKKKKKGKRKRKGGKKKIAENDGVASGTPAGSATPPPPTREASPHWKVIPEVPSAPSPPPGAEAFASAKEINTADAAFHPSNCKMKIHGAWLQVKCTGSFAMLARTEDWGELGKDHLLGNPFYVRMRPGTIQRGTITPASGGRVAFEVTWPTGDPKPWSVTLEAVDKTLQRNTARRTAVQKEATALATLPWADKPRPAAADWVRAKLVSTAAPDQRLKGCVLRVLDGWLRATCYRNGDVGWTIKKGFGKRGKDYHQSGSGLANFTQLELPLRAGGEHEALLNEYLVGKGKLVVKWPAGAPHPAKIEITGL